jgi:hypothetical protein
MKSSINAKINHHSSLNDINLIENKIAVLNYFLAELKNRKLQIEIKINSYEEIPAKLKV